MEAKIYFANLPFAATEDHIRAFFAPQGQIVELKPARDEANGRFKGYGVLQMGSDAEAQAAIQNLNGKLFGNRKVLVCEARASTEEGYADQIARAVWGRDANGNPNRSAPRAG